jgi:hypothetical protein
MVIVILTIIAVVWLGWPWWVVPLATAGFIAWIVVTPTPAERSMHKRGLWR